MFKKIIDWLKYRKDRARAMDRAVNLAVGLALSGGLPGIRRGSKKAEVGHVAGGNQQRGSAGVEAEVGTIGRA